MAPDGQTAGGLAADDGVGLRHLGGDVLEAHGDFVALLTHILCDPIQQVGGRVVAHAGAGPAAVFQQVVVEQNQQGVGMEERALLVDDAQTVGVAVGGNAQIAAVVHHVVAQQLQGVSAGGGHFAAKEGVVLLMNDIHVTPAGQQNGAQAALADAIHGVDGDAQVGTLDLLGVNDLQNAVDVLVEGIAFPDQTHFHGLIVVDGLHVLRLEKGNLLLDLSGDDLIGVPAAGGEDLDAVVDRGVVAGGDGQTIGGLHLLDGEHDQRGGGGTGDHKDVETIARQNLRRPVGGFLGQEAPVVADTDLLALVSFQQHQLAKAGYHQTDIFLGEFVCDNRPPSTGTKFNHLDFLLSRLFTG